VEQVSEFSPCCLDGSGFRVAHPVLELGEELLDGIEVGAVGRQEEQMRAGLADGAAGGLSLVAAEIVEDDDVALCERRGEDLFGVEREEFAVDRAVDDEGRIDTIDPEGSDESERLPVTMRRAGLKTLSLRPQPRSGAMLVLIQVSSMKTRRRGSILA